MGRPIGPEDRRHAVRSQAGLVWRRGAHTAERLTRWPPDPTCAKGRSKYCYKGSRHATSNARSAVSRAHAALHLYMQSYITVLIRYPSHASALISVSGPARNDELLQVLYGLDRT